MPPPQVFLDAIQIRRKLRDGRGTDQAEAVAVNDVLALAMAAICWRAAASKGPDFATVPVV